MHGFSRLTDSAVSWPRRLFWAVMLSAGLGFSFYNIALQIKHFTNTPVHARLDIKRPNLLPMPQVTVCNYNSMKRSSANQEEIRERNKTLAPLWANESFAEPDFGPYHYSADNDTWTKFYEDYSPKIEEYVMQVPNI